MTNGNNDGFILADCGLIVVNDGYTVANGE